MPKILIIGTESFEFPISGENPSYAEEITDWAEAVSDALSTVQQPNDVTTTSASILNNQLTFADISGFLFDTTEVIAINSEFIIKRNTTVPVVNLVESGSIQGNYDGAAWTYIIESVGNAGVEFNITSAGQLQYKSSNLTGTAYVGSITFKAKVFNS